MNPHLGSLALRLFVLAAVVLAVAACGDSNTTPTGTKPPTTTASFDTLLTNASIPPSGGTITVSKSGDPLNGLTMTVSSGAFSNALTVTIGSSTNQNLPTGNGIVPISPVVHVRSSAGYANGSIVFKIPVTVPANTFPIAVWYDSATKALEPMATIAYDGKSVTAVTGHLETAAPLSPSAARVRTRSNGDGGDFVLGVFAVSAADLAKDWDTGFRPGTNDWEMPSYPTEGTQNENTLLGTAATELWYYNTRASSIPLSGRFPIVKNAPLSDKIGYRWVSVIEKQVSTEFNQFAGAAYQHIQDSASWDTLQFNTIRASFAIAAQNGGAPLPMLVDLQNATSFYYLVAYKSTGNKIYVADPVSPGDGTRFLQFGSDGMTPYVNPGFTSGARFVSPLVTPLGAAIPLPTIASSYSTATSGTIGNDIFPAASFYSWAGQLYDTMYVVDSLRIWAQCAQCQYGFATTLSPAPSGNVASSFNIYKVLSGLVADSIGYLSANGLPSNIPVGTQATFGIPLASANAANAPTGGAKRWLDWQQITIANLQGTVALPTGGILVNDPDTLQVSFQPNLLPANVAYQWSFGDSTPTVTVQNNAAVQHSFAKAGTLTTTVKVIDNRNNQVIARVDTTINPANVELWQIQSFTWLHTLINGAVSDSAHSYLAFTIQPGTVPTLIALNGPPFPGGYYPEAGFGFASPPDSAQEWAQVKPTPLAISAAYPPIDVFGYTNTGTATSGTITGQSLEAHTGVVTNSGYTVNLTKKGSMLSGYIMVQGTYTTKGVSTTVVVVDSVVAVRVHS